ncbi:hypothetical protein RFI_37178, partial [Reticulomyxa filosa]
FPLQKIIIMFQLLFVLFSANAITINPLKNATYNLLYKRLDNSDTLLPEPFISVNIMHKMPNNTENVTIAQKPAAGIGATNQLQQTDTFDNHLQANLLPTKNKDSKRKKESTSIGPINNTGNRTSEEESIFFCKKKKKIGDVFC